MVSRFIDSLTILNWKINSISTLQNDIVLSEQGYFDYEVNNEQWKFMQKIISKLLTLDELLEKLDLKFDLELQENDWR